MNEAMNRIADLLETAGPSVTEAALRAARLDALSYLAVNALGAVIGLALFFCAWAAFRTPRRKLRACEYLSERENALMFLSVIAAILGALSLLGSVSAGLDFVAWQAALGDPAPYLLRELR